MDVTGVGRPVFDIFSDALRARCPILPSRSREAGAQGQPRFPRAVDAQGAARVSPAGALAVPPHREAGDGTDASYGGGLRVYEVRVSDEAKLTTGAFKTGTHDDMATALGLSVLFDPTGQRVTYSPAPWA